MEFDYYSTIDEERLHLESIAKKPRNILHGDMKNTLSKYFKNLPLLDLLVTHDLFLSEYAFLERAAKNESLSQSLSELFSIYASAKEKNEDKYLKLLADYTTKVSSAADNCAQMDALMQTEVPQFSKAATKQTFMEIGEFLEGSFQVFSKFTLSCIYISEDKCTDIIQGMNFGKCIAEINNKSVLKDAYNTLPWGIPLSQWRNIAAHNSYKMELGSEQINCNYGHENKKEVRLNLVELYHLKYSMMQFYNAHKISHAIVYIENQEGLKKYNPAQPINPETLLHQIKEFSYSLGFLPHQPTPNSRITKMKLDVGAKDEFFYKVVNMSHGEDVFKRAQMLAFRISTLLAGHDVLVEAYDNNGNQLCCEKYGSNA